jgi:hypothetical protein
MDDIYATLVSRKAHIFAATETWLHDGIEDGLIQLPNYIHHRNDRQNRKGGGACVWIHTSMTAKRLLPTNQPEFLDSVWLSIPAARLIFVCMYIPPDNALSCRSVIDEYVISNCDAFLCSRCDFEVVLCGDFNRYNIQNVLTHLDLVNLVTEPTRGSALLDYFLISLALSTNYTVNVTSPIANSDHSSICATPDITASNRKGVKKHLYDLRQENIDRFVTALTSINWAPFYLSSADIDEKCDMFHDILASTVARCIPSRTVEMSTNDKPWITPLVKYSIQQRWNAYRSKNFPLYKHWKEKTKNLILAAKKNWSQKAKNNSKNLWQVTNSVRGTKSNEHLISLVNQFKSAQDATNCINNKLTAVFEPKLSCDKKTDSKEGDNDLWLNEISVASVERFLLNIKSSKAPGSEQIPSILYKTGALSMAGPITHIFNLSITQERFPKRWKSAHVCPIPKTNPPDLEKLRPISLLPIPSKVLERLVLNSVVARFYENFGPNQFGCRPFSSTTCAVIKLIHHAYSLLELANVTGVKIITYDFTKAFDRLSHQRILDRLTDTRFPAPFVTWTQDYLSGRTQAVRIGTSVSSPSNVSSGVPQGSVLGPMFFCLVVGSLKPLHEHTCIIQYVDDTTLCMPTYKNNTNQHISEEHRHLLQWCDDNGFTVNREKCKTVYYSKSSQSEDITLPNIKAVEELKFLGVVINRRLKWNSHVDLACRNASRRIYALRILRQILSPQQLTTVYSAVIRSILEYVSPAFGNLPKKLGRNLERLQKRCHRLICGSNGSDGACGCNRFTDLTTRRNQAAIKLYKSAAHNSSHVLHEIIPPRSNRSAAFIQPPAASSRFLHSFIPFTTALLNGTPINL